MIHATDHRRCRGLSRTRSSWPEDLRAPAENGNGIASLNDEESTARAPAPRGVPDPRPQ